MSKTIAIKVDLKGAEEQVKKLSKLETEVKKLTNRRTQLNKAQKAGTISLKRYGQEMAIVNTKLKANRRNMLVLREQMLGMDSFTKKLGKSFMKMGTTIVASFAGMFAIQKIGQLFVNATKVVKDFEQQMAKVQAITGASGVEFAKLEKSAKELGATTQFTATQVGQMQEEFAKLGFTTEQILDATGATLDLATATGSDLAQSAKVATATINGFGLEAKDTKKVVDIMAKSFTSSALDLSKFETAMASVAPVASTVGWSLEEATASLGVLADAGFDASTAGTALRNILLDTQKAGITTAEAFDKIKNSTDPTTTALELFGKRGASVAVTLAKATDKTADFTRELENSRGSAEAMAKIVGDTLEGDIKRFNSAWEGMVLNLGENANDLFRGVVEGATDFITVLSDMTKNVHAESDAMRQQGVEANALVSRIVKLKEGDEDRLKLLNELNILNPKITKGMNLQKVSNEELSTSLNKYNDELIKNIILKREQEELTEQANEVADIEREKLKDSVEAEELLGKIRLKALESIRKAEIRGRDTETTKFRRKQLEIINQTNLSWEEQASLLATINSTAFREKEVAELSALRRSTRRLNDDLKDESNILEQLKKRAEALEEQMKGTQETTEEGAEESTDAIDETTESVEKLAFKLEELSEIEDPLDIDGDELTFEKKIDSAQNYYDKILEMSEKHEAIQDSFNEQRTAKEANLMNKKLEEERAFREKVRSEQFDLAEQTANALIEVSSRRFEREKTLELANLDARLENGLISQAQFEKEREAIERKAFQRQKRMELAQIAISLAREIASINATSASNPMNGPSFGIAGLTQAQTLTGLAVARSAVQAGIIASQKFADGGYTGDGFGSPDSTGFKQAGIVHEGEYVVPKNVLESQRGSQLVGALEAMRNNKPQPYSGFGFANGGFTSGQSIDMTDLENRISKAVASSIGSIQVVNNATDTVTEAMKVSNIQSSATFG